MSIEEKTPVTEGIFEVRKEQESAGSVSWDRTLSTTEGTIKGIQEKEIIYGSKKERGVCITLENSLGSAEVEFPRILALTDRRAIIGQGAKYTKFHELYDEIFPYGGSLNTCKYTLNILTGNLAEEEIKEERTY